MFWFKKRKTDEAAIYARLAGHVDPAAIEGVVLQAGQVLATIRIQPEQAKEWQQRLPLIEADLRQLPGIDDARLILTAERAPGQAASETAASRKPLQPTGRQEVARAVAPQVKQIIAVASGKGGVGKSTVAVNLALGLRQLGLNVGLLDADVYGPSVPMLLGVRDRKPENKDDYLIPVEAFGLKIMSMGFMVEEESPMVWRGPMVQSALLQMLRDVQWGALDVLVIDMPPGTGDTQLTIAQRVALAGAVIVSTPQDVALLDTVKGIHMFEKVSVPVLGVVENMSFFCCPHCGKDSAIFGSHGARDRAAALNVPFLGGVPITIDLRQASDEGRPLTATAPEHDVSKLFITMAEKIYGQLQAKSGQKPPPRIIVEPAA